MRESIYRFKPVGHNPPDQKRSYAKPDQRLRKVFEEWLEEVKDINYFYPAEAYNLALKLIENLNPDIPEAHSLLVAYQDYNNIEYAGYLLSAIYNRSPEKEIVFDLHLQNPPYGLGYRLPKGKRLVNRGKAGGELGWEASGVVINYDKAGDGMGWEASGVVINYGKAGDGMGWEASGVVINYGKAGDGMGCGAPAIVINFGEVGILGYLVSRLVINCGKADVRMIAKNSAIILTPQDPAGFSDLSKAKLVLKAEDCKKIPELGEYLENLRRTLEAGRQDYHAVLAWLEGLGQKPGDRIESEIKNILTKAGYGYKIRGWLNIGYRKRKGTPNLLRK